MWVTQTPLREGISRLGAFSLRSLATMRCPPFGSRCLTSQDATTKTPGGQLTVGRILAPELGRSLAHIRQSMPGSCLGFQVKVLQCFDLFHLGSTAGGRLTVGRIFAPELGFQAVPPLRELLLRLPHCAHLCERKTRVYSTNVFDWL